MSAFVVACLVIFGGASRADAQGVRMTANVVQTTALRTVATPTLHALSTTAYDTALAVSTTSAKPAYGPVADEGLQAIPTTTTAPGMLVPVNPAAIVRVEAPFTGDLAVLVDANLQGDVLDEEAGCLATAVYFEARGESLDGQLAVAQVVMNRAASGRYPASWCAVVKQPAQFSFVHRGGGFPAVNEGCAQWARAQAIARIAAKGLMSRVASDVLWYHANYVAPSWGHRLNRVSQIGAHIFYRA